MQCSGQLNAVFKHAWLLNANVRCYTGCLSKWLVDEQNYPSVHKTNPAFEWWQVIISYPESLSTYCIKNVGNETMLDSVFIRIKCNILGYFRLSGSNTSAALIIIHVIAWLYPMRRRCLIIIHNITSHCPETGIQTLSMLFSELIPRRKSRVFVLPCDADGAITQVRQ